MNKFCLSKEASFMNTIDHFCQNLKNRVDGGFSKLGAKIIYENFES